MEDIWGALFDGDTIAKWLVVAHTLYQSDDSSVYLMEVFDQNEGRRHASKRKEAV